MLHGISATTTATPLLLRRDGHQASLRPAEEFTAVVRQADDSGAVSLEIKGLTVPAQSLVALRQGERIRLQVVQLQPTILLRLVTPSGAAGVPLLQPLIQALRTSLPAWRPLEEVLQQLAAQLRTVEPASLPPDLAAQVAKLSALLHSLIFSTSGDMTPAKFRQLLMGSGLRYEARLAALLRGDADAAAARALVESDLKGLLLLMRASLEERDALAQLALQRQMFAVDGFLQALQAQQLLDALGRERGRGRTRRFQVPLGLLDQLIGVTIEVEEPPGEEAPPLDESRAGRAYHLLFSLELKGSGCVVVELRVDFARRQLSGRVATDSVRLLVPLQALVGLLRKRLESLELQLGEVRVEVLEEESLAQRGPAAVAQAGLELINLEV